MKNKKESTSQPTMAQIVILVITITLFAWLLVLFRIKDEGIEFKFTKAIEDPGQIGDLIGGVSSPFIGLIGALLTFLAFWIQYKFNEFQTIKIEQQEKEFNRSRIEGLFYEMLRIHRENVSEITIKDISKSRRAFISMFKEFKFCYYALEEVYNSYPNANSTFLLDKKQLVNISFITFFFGIGESSEEIVNSLLVDYDENFRTAYYNKLSNFQNEWKRLDEEAKKERKIACSSFESSEIPALKKAINIQTSQGQNYELTTGYKPFSGHLARLGHYFRHLFQIVYFIDAQDVIGKQDYVRTLRAQISAHEQLLLYYNSLTVMGERWWTEGFINEYGIIKNIPLPLANVGPEPIKLLGNQYFEWSEITRSFKDTDINLGRQISSIQN